MTYFRYFILLISIIWAAEDIVKALHATGDSMVSIAMESKGEEKSEEENEHEVKEYIDNPSSVLTRFNSQLRLSTITPSYRPPTITLFDVPPQPTC